MHTCWCRSAIWSRHTVPLAIGQVCNPPGGGNSSHEVVQPSEGSRVQVRHDFSDSGRLFVAVSLWWAGGRLHSGIPDSKRSCQVCSGFEQHSDTCSSRTLRREPDTWVLLDSGLKALNCQIDVVPKYQLQTVPALQAPASCTFSSYVSEKGSALRAHHIIQWSVINVTR